MDIAEIDKLPCAQRFSKRVILKVAEIVDVSVHPGGSFLYVLTLDTNEETIQFNVEGYYKITFISFRRPP